MKKHNQFIAIILLCISFFYSCTTQNRISEISEESFDIGVSMEISVEVSTPESSIVEISELSDNSKYKVFNTETETGFYKPDGTRIILDIICNEILSFSDDRSIIIKDDKYGVINTNGEIIVPLKYDNINRFFGGYSTVEINTNEKVFFGVIDVFGTEIIPVIYSFIDHEFKDGLISAEMDGKCGFLNHNNEIIIPFEYDESEAFSSGLAVVMKKGKYGLINVINEIIVPFEYEFIDTFTNGFSVLYPIYVEVWESNYPENLKPNPDYCLVSYAITNFAGDIIFEDPTVYKYNRPFGKGLLFSDTQKSKQGYPIFKNPEPNLATVNINGLWGKPSYGTPFIWPGGKTDIWGQYENEPIYKNVVEWDEDIPFDLVPLEENSEG